MEEREASHGIASCEVCPAILKHLNLSHHLTKPTRWSVCPAKTLISYSICTIWSESLLSTWRKLGSLVTRWAHSKTVIRLGGCPSWSESSLGAQVILLVLSCCSSFNGGEGKKVLKNKLKFACIWVPYLAHYAFILYFENFILWY